MIKFKFNSHVIAATLAAVLLGSQIATIQASEFQASSNSLPACKGGSVKESSYTYGCLSIAGTKCYDGIGTYFDQFNYKYRRFYSYSRYDNGIRIRSTGAATKIKPQQCCTTNSSPTIVRSSCK